MATEEAVAQAVDNLPQQVPSRDMPLSWSVVLLGNALSLIGNGLTVKQDKSGQGYPITRIETISDEGINIEKLGYVGDISEQVAEKYRLQRGDILVSHINSEPQIGRSVLYEGVPATLLHGMNLLRLRTKPDVLHAAFLDYLLKYYRVRGVFVALASRAVGQASINQGKLNALNIPLPSLPEQRAIARILRTVQGAIQARRRELELERERKAALMQHLFTHGTRGEPTKLTEIGEMPQSWEEVTLGSVASISTGTTPATDVSAYYQGNIPFIKTADVANRRIASGTTHISERAVQDYNLKLYKPGTIFLAMYGQGKTRGQVAILDITAATTQNTAAIVPGNQLNPEYAWHWLMSQYDSLRNAGHQGHISHLNLGYVKQYFLPLPRLDEQCEIADALAASTTKMSALDGEVTLLEELFRALLEELMTGRLSALPLVETEPAEAEVPA